MRLHPNKQCWCCLVVGDAQLLHGRGSSFQEVEKQTRFYICVSWVGKRGGGMAGQANHWPTEGHYFMRFIEVLQSTFLGGRPPGRGI